MSKQVITDSGLKGWQDRLQNVYDSFEEFEGFCEYYDLHKRLHYSTPEKAWAANPLVQGSTAPSDFRQALKTYITLDGREQGLTFSDTASGWTGEQIAAYYDDSVLVSVTEDSKYRYVTLKSKS